MGTKVCGAVETIMGAVEAEGPELAEEDLQSPWVLLRSHCEGFCRCMTR